MTLIVRDTLGGALVPPSVVVHAMARVAAPERWTLVELSASGDIGSLHDGSMQGLIDDLPATVSWRWIEHFADLVDDVEWFDVTGNDVFGDALRLRCFDSTTWEVTGSPKVEAGLKGFFHEATLE